MKARHRAGAVSVTALLVTAGAVLTGPAGAQAEISGWQLDAIKASQAQGVSTGDGVVVAVVDSGVGPHPDLEGHVLEGESFADADDPTRDGEGHGSNMAAQVLSVAPDAQILPVQVAESSEQFATGPVVEGIRWAVDNGADIVNVSIAGESATNDQIEAIQYALDNDVVVIAGTGNDPGADVGAPASIPGVIAVSGFGESGDVWSGATTGPETVLSAPAENIESITPKSPGVEAGYRKGEGTSIATALVSGVAALVRAEYPDLKAPDVINRLITTAEDAGDEGRDDEYGYGKVDAEAALTADVPTVTENPLGDPATLLDEDKATGYDDRSSDDALGTVALIAGVGLVVLIAAVVLIVVLVRRGRKKRGGPPGPPHNPYAYRPGPPPPPPVQGP